MSRKTYKHKNQIDKKIREIVTLIFFEYMSISLSVFLFNLGSSFLGSTWKIELVFRCKIYIEHTESLSVCVFVTNFTGSHLTDTLGRTQI